MRQPSKRYRMSDAVLPAVPPRLGPQRRIAGAIFGPVVVSIVLVGLLEILKRQGLLPITVPAPSEVATAFAQSWGDLLYHAQPTVLSAATGFALAAALALTLGSIAVSWRPDRAGDHPLRDPH